MKVTDVTKHNGKYISYLRVSTAKQGESGLGVEAQRAAVENWLNGGNWELIEEVVEVESGKSHRNRPGLTRALDACRRYGAKLIISRLDRLSRDPVFLLSLRDAGIDFIAVDMPNANRMTVGVMALVAEQERGSDQPADQGGAGRGRARGVGSASASRDSAVNNRDVSGRRRAGERRSAPAANEFARLIRPLLEGALAGQTANAIASALNERGVMTARGGKWTARSVINLKARKISETAS